MGYLFFLVLHMHLNGLLQVDILRVVLEQLGESVGKEARELGIKSGI